MDVQYTTSAYLPVKMHPLHYFLSVQIDRLYDSVRRQRVVLDNAGASAFYIQKFPLCSPEFWLATWFRPFFSQASRPSTVYYPIDWVPSFPSIHTVVLTCVEQFRRGAYLQQALSSTLSEVAAGPFPDGWWPSVQFNGHLVGESADGSTSLEQFYTNQGATSPRQLKALCLVSDIQRSNSTNRAISPAPMALVWSRTPSLLRRTPLGPLRATVPPKSENSRGTGRMTLAGIPETRAGRVHAPHSTSAHRAVCIGPEFSATRAQGAETPRISVCRAAMASVREAKSRSHSRKGAHDVYVRYPIADIDAATSTKWYTGATYGRLAADIADVGKSVGPASPFHSEVRKDNNQIPIAPVDYTGGEQLGLAGQPTELETFVVYQPPKTIFISSGLNDVHNRSELLYNFIVPDNQLCLAMLRDPARIFRIGHGVWLKSLVMSSVIEQSSSSGSNDVRRLHPVRLPATANDDAPATGFGCDCDPVSMCAQAFVICAENTQLKVPLKIFHSEKRKCPAIPTAIVREFDLGQRSMAGNIDLAMPAHDGRADADL
ncbi:hypothetical protein DFH08DRAFT_815340 [Mycena albidolilacea]|uniref:Uncharacterized protein n=1 Tax=Mycena albidolilacea TaxID=1033008 RepID=A0AAD7EJ44_9AGAR|nr:hypothetical protein DFH08DRAFT_815340 [Mycena albidolilacea]